MSGSDLELCTRAVEDHEVVPDVLDSFDPQFSVQIRFESGVEAQLGNELTPTQVQARPTVSFDPQDTQAFYSVIMQDPDAPSRADPKFREWHHWWVGNIPGNKVSEGEELSQYVGSGPPPNTGLHRYVFVVLRQRGGKLSFADLPRLTNTSADGRGGSNLRKWIEEYDLEPLALNFYQAEYDDYVPKLYKQLSGN